MCNSFWHIFYLYLIRRLLIILQPLSLFFCLSIYLFVSLSVCPFDSLYISLLINCAPMEILPLFIKQSLKWIFVQSWKLHDCFLLDESELRTFFLHFLLLANSIRRFVLGFFFCTSWTKISLFIHNVANYLQHLEVVLWKLNL